jgi:hypothetical protein
MDKWVAYCVENNQDINYTMSSTPNWAADLTAPALNDPWAVTRGGFRPANLSDLGTFITELVTRYNVTLHPTVKPIKYIEAWNETRFNNVRISSGSHFWGDTVDNMVLVTKTIYQAAKAVDPTIQILSPSASPGGLPKNVIRSPAGTIASFLRQSDGSGGFGYNWIDGIAIHMYDVVESDITNNIIHNHDVYYEIKQLQDSLGINLPIHNTESGYASASPGGRYSYLDFDLAIGRALVSHIAFGLRTSILYSWTSLESTTTRYYLGNIRLNDKLQKMLKRIHDELIGSTIPAEGAVILTDGRYRVTNERGTFYY